MSNCWKIASIFVFAILATFTPAGSVSLYEDFSTTSYKDEINTSAEWNTADGELRLPVFVPELVGHYASPDLVSVSVSGNLLAGANGTGELQFFDVTNPSSPGLLSSNSFPFELFDVALLGNLAYVAADSGGLKIIDISDPSMPVLLSSYASSGHAQGLDVHGSWVLLADGESGVHLIDVSDPVSPTLMSSYDTAGYAYQVKLFGDLALVADGSAGLVVLDLSDPTSLSMLGSYDTPGTALDLDAAGNQVFVSDFYSGLQVISVRYPDAPVLAGSFATTAGARAVSVQGDLAYVSVAEVGLMIVDINDVANPQLLDEFDSSGIVFDAAIEGENAFLADYYGGLQVVKISQSIEPRIILRENYFVAYNSIAIAGNTAYLTKVGSEIQIVDISDPLNAVYHDIFSLPLAATARGIEVHGDLLYVTVAGTGGGLYILDITQPRDPVLIGQYTGGDASENVTVANEIAYLTHNLGNLDILDVSDPTNPVLLFTYYTGAGTSIETMQLQGNLLYLGFNSNGLQIMDVSNPASPLLLSHIEPLLDIDDIALAGDYAYMINYGGYFRVANVSDPFAPYFISELDTHPYKSDIKLSGDFAFVGRNGFGGMEVYDISDPLLPVRIHDILNLDGGEDLELFGNHVIFLGDNGLTVIEVFDTGTLEDQNIGQSLTLDLDQGPITHVRLDATQTTGVSWELNTLSPDAWLPITPGDSWLSLDPQGDDLLWRSTHTSDGVTNPTVSDLTVEWLNEFAWFSSMSDVPSDQGGWMQLNFMRSGYDFADEIDHPVTGYQLYRRVDDPMLRESIEMNGIIPSMVDAEHPGLASFDPGQIRTLGDRSFLSAGDREELPAGTWEVLNWVAARQTDEYIVEAHTQADSTAEDGIHWSVFLTTTHTSTPSVWFASQPDSGYSVDNLAPNVPSGFLVDHDPYGISNLNWDEHDAQDFRYFRVYRGETADFEIGAEALVHETIDTNWTDEASGVHFFYKITALDFAGNESDPTTPDEVVDVDDAPPVALTLHANVPNPFNPSTEIRFDLPTAGAVRLSVYDVTGRMVRDLISEHLEPGVHVYTWDGRAGSGQAMASGIYFSVLSTEDRTLRQKMVLLK